jgi:hypothetical protein
MFTILVPVEMNLAVHRVPRDAMEMFDVLMSDKSENHKKGRFKNKYINIIFLISPLDIVCTNT